MVFVENLDSVVVEEPALQMEDSSQQQQTVKIDLNKYLVIN